MTRFKSIVALRSRIKTNYPNRVQGSEPLTRLDHDKIESLSQNLRLLSDENRYYLDINPNPDESAYLEAKFASSYRDIIQRFGFLSPAAMVIGDYVRFYMMRYKTDDPEQRKQCEDGLIAEKAFDLIMQNMGLYVNYPEPIRDWRLDHPLDFDIPLLGKVETKSITPFRGGYRVNVTRSRWLNDKPDYLVALQHIGGQYVMLVNAMRSKRVKSYDTAYNGEFYIKRGKPPFWSIPVEHLDIQGWKLMQTLESIKRDIDNLPKQELYP